MCGWATPVGHTRPSASATGQGGITSGVWAECSEWGDGAVSSASVSSASAAFLRIPLPARETVVAHTVTPMTVEAPSSSHLTVSSAVAVANGQSSTRPRTLNAPTSSPFSTRPNTAPAKVATIAQWET